MKLSEQETEIEMSEDKVYKVSKNSGELGDIEFSPGLPNDLLIQDLLNNKKKSYLLIQMLYRKY